MNTVFYYCFILPGYLIRFYMVTTNVRTNTKQSSKKHKKTRTTTATNEVLKIHKDDRFEVNTRQHSF